MILNEFDDNKDSTFNPDDVVSPIQGMPKIGITCFSHKIIDRLVEVFKAEEISFIKNSNFRNPIYKINYNGNEYALFMSFVGAPACVSQYEEAFVMGIETLVVFGTCGVLDKNIKDLSIIIPNGAIRDEGTSYHYLKESEELSVNEKHKDLFIDLLTKHNYSYVEGKTWTIDAPYRETRDKVQKRKQMGCICVDMELSAISALAKFRNKEVFQFFYAADNLDGAKWDMRSLGKGKLLSEKEKIGMLAIELAEKISEKKNS